MRESAEELLDLSVTDQSGLSDAGKVSLVIIIS